MTTGTDEIPVPPDEPEKKPQMLPAETLKEPVGFIDPWLYYIFPKRYPPRPILLETEFDLIRLHLEQYASKLVAGLVKTQGIDQPSAKQMAMSLLAREVAMMQREHAPDAYIDMLLAFIKEDPYFNFYRENLNQFVHAENCQVAIEVAERVQEEVTEYVTAEVTADLTEKHEKESKKLFHRGYIHGVALGVGVMIALQILIWVTHG